MLRPAYAVPLRAQVDCPPQWHPPVTAALAAAGVHVDPTAPVGVAVGAGRAVSDVVDGWSVDSLPHLLLAVRPYAVEVGPWVAPGIGPCARCVAASVLDDDPPGGTPPSRQLPLPLLALSAGAVARDLDAWARGTQPLTWSTSWRHDHHPLPTARRWQRHPYCGCAWFDTV